MPAEFGMIAALHGDLDTSDAVGRVFFRQDSNPNTLQRAAEHINRAFPEDDEVDPTHAVVITWVDVASKDPKSEEDTIKKVSFGWLYSDHLLHKRPLTSCLILYYPEKHLPAGYCIPGDRLLCYCPVCKRWDTVFHHTRRRGYLHPAWWLQQGLGPGFPVFQCGTILPHHY